RCRSRRNERARRASRSRSRCWSRCWSGRGRLHREAPTTNSVYGALLTLYHVGHRLRIHLCCPCEQEQRQENHRHQLTSAIKAESSTARVNCTTVTAIATNGCLPC